MIKKIILSLVLCYFIVSCGKKADPEYKESLKKNEIKIIIQNKA